MNENVGKPAPLDPDLRARLDLALVAARAAGEAALRHFRRMDLRVETKADASPVTVADREAEASLREHIRQAFPGDGILGEEFGETPGASGYRWILDPIDGTRSFTRGVPLFGTLVAVEQEARSVIGVIHLPACGESVHAAAGGGAWWTVEGRAPVPARVSQVAELDDAVLLVTSPEGMIRRGRHEAFQRLQSRCRMLRTWGDCYGYALVATGRAEIMADPALAVWDAAALLPILTESGGAFTGWNGEASIYAGGGVATNGLLHAEVQGILAASDQS